MIVTSVLSFFLVIIISERDWVLAPSLYFNLLAQNQTKLKL